MFFALSHSFFCWEDEKHDIPGMGIPECCLPSLHQVWRGWRCCFRIQPWALLPSTKANLSHSPAYSCKQDPNSALSTLSNWLWIQMRKWLAHKGLILAKPPSCFSRFIFFNFKVLFFSWGKLIKNPLNYVKDSCKCLTTNHKTQNRKKKKNTKHVLGFRCDFLSL